MFVKARAVLFKFERNGFLFRYSTTAPTHFTVEYLINSLGFSKEEAISASAKVTRTNPLKNPALSVNFFRKTGFNDTQIKILVYKCPDMLFYDVEKTLKPKLQYLSELGLSGSDLVKVLLRDFVFLKRGLETSIKPHINCLKKVVGSDENVVKVIKRCSWLISYNQCKTMESNLNLLRSSGCSNDKIKQFVLRRAELLKLSTMKLEKLLHRVEKDFRVSPDSTVFLPIISVLAGMSREKIDTKFGIFKSFGWSDTDVLTMFQKLPYCVALSEARIQTSLAFLMTEVRLKSIYIAARPSLLAYSVEKRLLPRYEIWKFVNEKNLIQSANEFYTVTTWPESKFLDKYVLPVKGELPNLYDLYIKRIGK